MQPPTLPTRFWGAHPLFWADVRLTSTHFGALESSPDLPGSHLLYRTHPIQKAELAGRVVLCKLGDSRRTVHIDDGAGGAPVQATIYETNVDGTVSHHFRARVGDLVVVNGKISLGYRVGTLAGERSREVWVRSVRRLADEAELAAHVTHTRALHAAHYRRPLSAWMPGIPGLDAYNSPQLVAAAGGGASASVAAPAPPPADDSNEDDVLAVVQSVLATLGALHPHCLAAPPERAPDGGGGASRTPSPTPLAVTLLPEVFTARDLLPHVREAPAAAAGTGSGSSAAGSSNNNNPGGSTSATNDAADDDGGDDVSKALLLRALRFLVDNGRLYRAPRSAPVNQLALMDEGNAGTLSRPPSSASSAAPSAPPSRKRRRLGDEPDGGASAAAAADDDGDDDGVVRPDTRLGIVSDELIVRPAVLALLATVPRGKGAAAAPAAPPAAATPPAVWSSRQLLDALHKQGPTARLPVKALKRVLEACASDGLVVVAGPGLFALDAAAAAAGR